MAFITQTICSWEQVLPNSTQTSVRREECTNYEIILNMLLSPCQLPSEQKNIKLLKNDKNHFKQTVSFVLSQLL